MGNSALLKTSLALQCVLEPLSECTDLKAFGHAPATETLALLFVDPGGTRNPTLHPEHSVHPSDRQTVSKASLPPSLPPSLYPSDHLNVPLHVITGGRGAVVSGRGEEWRGAI